MEFLKNISNKVKLIFAGIFSIIGFFLFFFIRSKIRARETVVYDLDRVRSEIKIAELEENEKRRHEKLASLKIDEGRIEERLAVLDKFEKDENREVTPEELDQFFKKRGL